MKYKTTPLGWFFLWAAFGLNAAFDYAQAATQAAADKCCLRGVHILITANIAA